MFISLIYNFPGVGAMSWLLQTAAHRALSQGQTPARHSQSVETSLYIETQCGVQRLYTLYTVSMVTSHGHILQCLLQLLLTCRPGEWIYYIMSVCLIKYLSYRDVDQSIDSYFIMDNGSLSPSILCFKLLINPCCTFGQAQMTDGVLTDQIFLQLSLTFQKGPIMI